MTFELLGKKGVDLVIRCTWYERPFPWLKRVKTGGDVRGFGYYYYWVRDGTYVGARMDLAIEAFLRKDDWEHEAEAKRKAFPWREN